jgi:hypothetical protein
MSFSTTGQRGSDGFWRTMETTLTNKSFVDRNISWFVLRRAGATTYWPPYILWEGKNSSGSKFRLHILHISNTQDKSISYL